MLSNEIDVVFQKEINELDDDKKIIFRNFSEELDKKNYKEAFVLLKKINEKTRKRGWYTCGSDFFFFHEFFLLQVIEHGYLQNALLDHLILNYKKEMNKTEPHFFDKFYESPATAFYKELCMASSKILWVNHDNSSIIEQKYLCHFPVDFNRVFFKLIEWSNLPEIAQMAQYLIYKPHVNLDLMKTNWYMDEKDNCIRYNKLESNLGYFITPLQGYLKKYLSKYDPDKLHEEQYALEEFLIYVYYHCNIAEIFRKDGRGNDIMFYLQEILQTHENKKENIYDDLKETISRFKELKQTSENVFMFFKAKHYSDTIELRNLTMDTCKEIVDVTLSLRK